MIGETKNQILERRMIELSNSCSHYEAYRLCGSQFLHYALQKMHISTACENVEHVIVPSLHALRRGTYKILIE